MKKSNYTGTDVEYEVEKEKKFVITRGMVILAIVVLIFIIAIIFIVSKLTENNNYSLPDYVQLESRMEEEAPIYISQNKIEIDTEPYKIMLKDLLYENGGTISLPVANECVGYVVAEKKETVEYKAYIKCNDSYITEGYKNEEPNVVPTTTAIPTTTAKDTVKPNILIIGEKQVNLYVGDRYEEPGFTATDNIDGDITSNVVVNGSVDVNKPGAYVLTYSIKDSSGNENNVTRTINVINRVTTTTVVVPKKTTTQKPIIKTTTKSNVTVSPTITLIGNSTITISKGTSYKEYGYYAQDGLGNDITSKVSISSNLNVNKVGTYKIEYTVVDEYGNAAVELRHIIVNEKQVPVAYITLTPDNVIIEKNKTVQIIVNYNSDATVGKEIVWKSSDTSIAYVNQNGLVTAKKTGIVTITATSSNGKTAKANITVK